MALLTIDSTQVVLPLEEALQVVSLLEDAILVEQGWDAEVGTTYNVAKRRFILTLEVNELKVQP